MWVLLIKMIVFVFAWFFFLPFGVAFYGRKYLFALKRGYENMIFKAYRRNQITYSQRNELLAMIDD